MSFKSVIFIHDRIVPAVGSKDSHRHRVGVSDIKIDQGTDLVVHLGLENDVDFMRLGIFEPRVTQLMDGPRVAGIIYCPGREATRGERNARMIGGGSIGGACPLAASLPGRHVVPATRSSGPASAGGTARVRDSPTIGPAAHGFRNRRSSPEPIDGSDRRRPCHWTRRSVSRPPPRRIPTGA